MLFLRRIQSGRKNKQSIIQKTNKQVEFLKCSSFFSEWYGQTAGLYANFPIWNVTSMSYMRRGNFHCLLMIFFSFFIIPNTNEMTKNQRRIYISVSHNWPTSKEMCWDGNGIQPRIQTDFHISKKLCRVHSQEGGVRFLPLYPGFQSCNLY